MEPRQDTLKDQLVRMAMHAESSVTQAIRALVRRDDQLAERTREEDSLIDDLEVAIDDQVLTRLGSHPVNPGELRWLTSVMKVAQDLERVGDEATTISRRVLALGQEPGLSQVREVPELARMAVAMLKEALDTFVNEEPAAAREVIPRDKAVDQMQKRLHQELTEHMSAHPETVERCLHLMVITKCLERIADHATNVAEMVVYMCEGEDIRHADLKRTNSTNATPPAAPVMPEQ